MKHWIVNEVDALHERSALRIRSFNYFQPNLVLSLSLRWHYRALHFSWCKQSAAPHSQAAKFDFGYSGRRGLIGSPAESFKKFI